MTFDKAAIGTTLNTARQKLLKTHRTDGFWRGNLSSSSLATATAVYALASVDAKEHQALIEGGLHWLADNQNTDGGWGDTVKSKSNISTTALCWAAFTRGENSQKYQSVVEQAQAWLSQQVGSLEPQRLAEALGSRYGRDRSFSAPILTMCALSGRLGTGRQVWSQVKALPFELAVLPQSFWKRLSLSVVSYALPALIAVGQVRFHHRPPLNPLTRLLRRLVRGPTLALLEKIQPASGGFLEAIPLTSFVVMSLASAGLQNHHKVVSKGIEFITASVRRDGSWPIDTNLATWLTTLSVNALSTDAQFTQLLGIDERRNISHWLVGQQYRTEHPYTQAAPGGWAWTDLPGGVPDADDTAAALIALRNLGIENSRVSDAARKGAKWLLDLQNRDGGIPTFCRGWGKLEFDRSAADLTAHALAAWARWFDVLPTELQTRILKAVERSFDYLKHAQRPDGSWVPLWFGNQFAPDEENPTYGTSRVLTALTELIPRFAPAAWKIMDKGAGWLISAQNDDGGWGGAQGTPSSIEETSLAVEALAKLFDCLKSDHHHHSDMKREPVEAALARGAFWLTEHTQQGNVMEPAPIGLYFARLWYFEELYPLIFTSAALGQVRSLFLANQL